MFFNRNFTRFVRRKEVTLNKSLLFCESSDKSAPNVSISVSNDQGIPSN